MVDKTIRNAVGLALAIAVLGMGAKAALGAGMPVSTNEAVCKLYLPNGGGFTGSGTIVGLSGDRKYALVVTAKHIPCHRDTDQVVEPLLDCVFENVPAKRGVRYHGRVAYVAPGKCDAAAIVIHNPGIPPVVIGEFTPQPGVYNACGYGGTANGEGRYKVARGPVIMTTLEGDIITRSAIWPGHSGGGLFDAHGRWCGITNLCDENGTGPNPNGITGSQSGEPLRRFMINATKECRPGFFTRWAERRGGGHSTASPGECPNGECGNPAVATQLGGGGGGYANLAPGYSAVGTTGVAASAPVPANATVITATPVPATTTVVATAPPMPASSPLASVPAEAPPAVDPFAPAVAAATPQPAPPAASAARAEVATTETSPVADPIAELAAGFEAVVERERKVQATREAVAAWQRAMSGQTVAQAPVLAERMAEAGSNLERRVAAIESRVSGGAECQCGPGCKCGPGCSCGPQCSCMRAPAAASAVIGDSPRAMIQRMPTVTVEVEYADKRERAIFNLASMLQEQLFEGEVPDAPAVAD